MTCECVQSCSEDKHLDLYNFMLTLPQPTTELIPYLPCGFFYVILESSGGVNVAKLMKKQ